MGTARAKNQPTLVVDDPAARRTNILVGGRGVFLPVTSKTDSCAITWAGPVLACFLLKSHCLTDPIWDKMSQEWCFSAWRRCSCWRKEGGAFGGG